MRVLNLGTVIVCLASCSAPPPPDTPELVTTAQTVTVLRPAPNHVRSQFRRFFVRNDVPEFCTNGAGHPHFGRDWCWERGYRLASGWRRLRVWHTPLKQTAQNLLAGAVADLPRAISPALFERLEKQRVKLGLSLPLQGSWLGSPYGRILIVRSGAADIGEITDADLDGHAEILWLYKGDASMRTVEAR